MGKYKFYQDRKVTSWERDYFSVEADSYEEAVAIVRSWNCEDVSNITDDRLHYDEWGGIDRHFRIHASRRKRRQSDNGNFQRRRRINNNQCTRNTAILK